MKKISNKSFLKKEYSEHDFDKRTKIDFSIDERIKFVKLLNLVE
jgi:hypothetical protein